MRLVADAGEPVPNGSVKEILEAATQHNDEGEWCGVITIGLLHDGRVRISYAIENQSLLKATGALHMAQGALERIWHDL